MIKNETTQATNNNEGSTTMTTTTTTTTTELTVTLEHGPNIDIMHDERAGYWAPPTDPPQMLVNVTSIADAVRTFCAWRERNELGGGNMTRRCGFIITDTHEVIGRISYNGRVWNADGDEIITK